MSGKKFSRLLVPPEPFSSKIKLLQGEKEKQQTLLKKEQHQESGDEKLGLFLPHISRAPDSAHSGSHQRVGAEQGQLGPQRAAVTPISPENISQYIQYPSPHAQKNPLCRPTSH